MVLCPLRQDPNVSRHKPGGCRGGEGEARGFLGKYRVYHWNSGGPVEAKGSQGCQGSQGKAARGGHRGLEGRGRLEEPGEGLRS